ncbi:hypothetical protein BGZ51_002599 [Haplosporangium sp. Z 767]|nr:hypothetical protein BGZ50_009354 [Haplosporangium sp. Z 11]KAF9193651.1 hypothetical protein BGZ51_002599 [Haplosporangium sp. Z 767]
MVTLSVKRLPCFLENHVENVNPQVQLMVPGALDAPPALANEAAAVAPQGVTQALGPSPNVSVQMFSIPLTIFTQGMQAVGDEYSSQNPENHDEPSPESSSTQAQV